MHSRDYDTDGVLPEPQIVEATETTVIRPPEGWRDVIADAWRWIEAA